MRLMSGVWSSISRDVALPLAPLLSFHGQCFMKSLRVYSVISMKEIIIIIIYIIFALHVGLYFLYIKNFK